MMKNGIIIGLTLIPFLTFGQNMFFKNTLGDKYLRTEVGFEKHLTCKAFNDLERQIEMTLINDMRYFRFSINFDLDKYYDLSFTIKKDKIFKLPNILKSDEMLLKRKPINRFYGNPVETKSYF